MTATFHTDGPDRSRHPSVRVCVPCDRLRHRVADALELELEGCEWPEVAAAVLEVRGRSGLGLVDFARRAGVDVELLARAEAGQVARDQLPGSLRRMVPR